jgi:hypothetical protein
MKFRHIQTRRAITLTEAMIAAATLVIAVIGTSVYRYQATLGVHQADLYSTGVRMTLLLCEGWSGTSGALSYNPVTTFSPELNIIASTGIDAPTGFTKLGSYKISIDGFPYYATLSWKNMGSGITSLHVVVKWNQTDRAANTLVNANKSYILTTYVKTPT